MKSVDSSNIIILDPNELLKKVKAKYGSQPIFPHKFEEAKKSAEIFKQFNAKTS